MLCQASLRVKFDGKKEKRDLIYREHWATNGTGEDWRVYFWAKRYLVVFRT